MQSTNSADRHADIEELLGPYALGAVSDRERRDIEAHLDDCAVCQARLQELLLAAAALPLIADEMEPPASLRERIRAAAVAEGRVPAAQPPPVEHPVAQLPRRGWVWPLAAILVVALLGLGIWNVWLQQRLGDERVEVIPLERADPTMTWQGELAYHEADRIAVLELQGLPVLEPGQLYQIWLIDDDVPIPSGTFTGPNARQALAIDISEYQAIAISVEPGPLGSTAPTTEPISVTPLAAT